MDIAAGLETQFFEKTGFLGEHLSGSLVRSNRNVDVLGQAMTTNPNPLDEYLAKIRAVCDGTTEDAELYEAIAHFCRQPQHRRGVAFVPLLKIIQGLAGLTKSRHPDFEEVLNDTWMKVYNLIDSEFEPPERSKSLRGSLVTWINTKLRLKFEQLDLWDKDKTKPLSLDAPVGSDRGENRMTLGDLLPGSGVEVVEEAISESKQQENIAMLLKIVGDPKNYVRSCPECTFKAVYEGRFFADPPKTLKQIALEFGVNQSNLRSFWNRTAKKIYNELTPKLKQALREYLEDK